MNIKIKIIILTLLTIYLPSVTIYLVNLYFDDSERINYCIENVENALSIFERELENELSINHNLLKNLSSDPTVLNHLRMGELSKLEEYLNKFKESYSLDNLAIYQVDKNDFKELIIEEKSLSLSIGQRIEEAGNDYYLFLNRYFDSQSLKTISNIAITKENSPVPLYSSLNSNSKGDYLFKTYSFKNSEYLTDYSVDIYINRSPLRVLSRLILPPLIMALLCLLLAALFYRLYTKRLLTPLEELNSHIDKIVNGSYKEKIELKEYPEFQLLVDGINDLARLLEKNSYLLEHSKQILEKKLTLRTNNLKSALDRLRRYNNTARENFYTTVHDLKTPLTIINGYASILLKYDNYDAKQRADFISKIHNEIMRLTNMLNSFLKSIKSHESFGDMSFGKIVITEILEYFYSIYEVQAKEMNVDFIWNIPASLPPLYGDREKLEHVISNLLSNAFKFVNKGGIVKLSAAVENSFVKLSVIDTGPGITKGNEENIFNKFKKFKTDSNDNINGTGLGLFIAHEIIKQHGGKIWAENNKGGQGCTFYFTVPIYKLSGKTSEKTDK